MAEALGGKPAFLDLPGIQGWHHGVDTDAIETRLRRAIDNA